MRVSKQLQLALLLFLLLPCAHTFGAAQEERPTINEIIIEGNRRIPTDAILHRIPYQTGDVFDPQKSDQAIHNINSLGTFNKIRIEQELCGTDTINLHIILSEKKLVESITFEGNHALSKNTLHTKLNTKNYSSIDRNDLARLTKSIKKLYAEDNYHKVRVTPHIVASAHDPEKVRVTFSIEEGSISRITYVEFKGNKKIPDHTLRKVIYTREDWLFSFLDEAGSYKPENFEIDRYRLEYFYRDQGYITAQVTNADVEFDDNSRDIHVTFEIEEGPRYKVGQIKILYDKSEESFSKRELDTALTLVPNKPYAQKEVVAVMQRLKTMWGNKGYIYADVFPQLKPNKETKKVDVTFHVDPGIKMYVNRINITGNTTTRDKVIRREIEIEEGDLLTTEDLLKSKSKIEYLGYFERDGVNWKIHRIKENVADLEINVRETKTGQASLNFTYGSEKNSPNRSLKGVLSFSKRNLLGRGIDTGLSLQANRHRIQRFQFDFFDPYFLDTDVSGAFNFYIKQDEYDQWKTVTPRPIERIVGGSTRFGFNLPSLWSDLQFLVELGVESISNNDPQVRDSLTREEKEFLEPRIARAFQKGNLNWFAAHMVRDTRNHRIYPNEGYRIAAHTKFALPLTNNTFSMAKAELEASWYTPLIGSNSLVLGLHARAGMIRSFSSNRIIPYKELFHMGGQDTVRGFVWGSIGPSFLGEPIGGRTMVQGNVELIFPLVEDYSMKAHLFYDAGAGWDTPKNDFSEKAKRLIIRDKFDLRHSIGFGVNLLYPQPVKVDFGYKLDRNREAGESASEWHLSMNTAW